MLEVHERSLVSGTGIQGKFLPPVALALFTLLARLLCHGPVYYSDGPHHIQSS
jgi:hypothetical protein